MLTINTDAYENNISYIIRRYKRKKMKNSILKNLSINITALSLTHSFLSACEEDVKRISENDNILTQMVSAYEQRKSIYKNQFEAAQAFWPESKQHYLMRSKIAREEADRYLHQAEQYSNLIPEINIKEEFRVLIASSIGTSLIKDPRTRILTIGLSLISDLARTIGVDVYDNFFTLREKLALSAAALEEANFYYRMAIGKPLRIRNEFFTNLDDLSDYFESVLEPIEDVMQYLIIIDMYTTTMEYKIDARVISLKLNKIREDILSELEKHGLVVSKHSDRIEGFKENFPEIIAECSGKDKLLSEEIYSMLEKVESRLNIVEARLDIK